MNDVQKRQFVAEIIDKDKWKEIITRFIDVLKINVFLLDFEGQVLLPPVEGRYGWEFFAQSCLHLDATISKANILEKFRENEGFVEYRCLSGLCAFAIPISGEENKIIAYLIVGPTILNKKEEPNFYQGIAEKLEFDSRKLMDVINDVRVVSNITIKSILDLLSEVAKDVVELNLEKRRLSQMKINQESLSKKVSEVAQDIYATIHLDELLVTLLDIALKMTNMECGSIMILDEGNQLAIKASRGLDEKVQSKRLKVGDGIAGLAVKENSPFIIHGTEGENRIQHLLKRPEIKHAIVMPINTKNRTCGVLNLHTKQENTHIEENLDNLQYLSRLISAAFQSI